MPLNHHIKLEFHLLTQKIKEWDKEVDIRSELLELGFAPVFKESSENKDGR